MQAILRATRPQARSLSARMRNRSRFMTTHSTDEAKHSVNTTTTTPHKVTPAVNQHSEEVTRVTKMGALVNAGLAVSKGVTGVAIGSTGMIADAANSCGDVLMDAAVYLTVVYSRQGNSLDKPWVRIICATLRVFFQWFCRSVIVCLFLQLSPMCNICYVCRCI
jgi:hypothetical protein